MDGDHRVSFKDFQEAIKQENLLLQGFGQCLPDDKVNTLVYMFADLIQLRLCCLGLQLFVLSGLLEIFPTFCKYIIFFITQ